jgi:hypothetical protein
LTREVAYEKRNMEVDIYSLPFPSLPFPVTVWQANYSRKNETNMCGALTIVAVYI